MHYQVKSCAASEQEEMSKIRNIVLMFLADHEWLKIFSLKHKKVSRKE